MRMLIIEDESEIGNFLKKHFEKEFFSVDYSAHGEEGSYFARTNDYAVIILDNILPVKSGLSIIRELRGMGRSTPIIMLSAKTDLNHKLLCFQEGVDDYVTKPFSFQELHERVKAVLRRPQSVQSDILCVQDIAIDSHRQEVTVAGKNVYLTRKEFLLLECLAKEKGKVMSRGTLIENIWNMNVDPFSNTLETHILNLRKKIGQKNGKRRGRQIIETIPGRGYKINV